MLDRNEAWRRTQQEKKWRRLAKEKWEPQTIGDITITGRTLAITWCPKSSQICIDGIQIDSASSKLEAQEILSLI